MKIKFLFLVPLFLFAFSQTIDAQFYTSAIGLRLGYPASVTYKTFLNEKAAFEGYVGLRPYSFGNFVNISGAYQIHNPIAGADGLQWYYGGGASIFFWNYDVGFGGDNFSSTTFGVQGYLGLDYTFADAPINLTLDWIPTVFLGGTTGVGGTFGGGYGSLAVRYTLGK